MRAPLVILIASVLSITCAAAAEGEWPEFMRSQFIDSYCVPSLQGEGYGAAAVETFCWCFAGQIEANFSPFEYEDILAAQPDPNGSSADRRLHAAVEACRPRQ